MYLTAQKVRPDAGVTEVINSFLHLHTQDISPDRVMDVLADVEGSKGILSFAECERRPGRAVVISYLDLVAPNSVASHDLESALRTARNVLSHDQNTVPFRLKVGPVAVEFGCTVGIRDAGRQLSDFDDLKTRSLKLERDRTRPFWFSDVPLDILLTPEERNGETVDRYELSPASASRVARLQQPGWRPHRFWAEPMVRADYEEDNGDFLPVVLSALVNLPKEEIAAMGGVRILLNGLLVRSWPQREKCEDIDTLCSRLTGYPSLASLFTDVSPNYVPSLYPRDDDWKRLADAYDAEADKRNDPRRAYRGPYRT